MTCKDCFHYEACKGTYEATTDCGITESFEEQHYADVYQCVDFSPKSEWAHLPCKVGTPVFFLRDQNIIETNVEKIIFKGKGCYIKLKCNAMYETSCQSIGKTVFFTRESAEKALAERSKK